MNRLSVSLTLVPLLFFSSQLQFPQNIIFDAHLDNCNIDIADSITNPKLNSNYSIKGLGKFFSANNNLNDKVDNPYVPLLNETKLNGGLLLAEYSDQSWRDLRWETNYKKIYRYDENHDCIEIIRQFESYGNGLENKYRNSYVYDNDKNVIESVAQNWDGLNWTSMSKSFYTYNDQNYLTEYLIQTWDSVIWVNHIRIILDYNGNNDCVKEAHQSWNGTAWIDLQILTYSYNENNNLSVSLWQDWDGLNWINNWKEIYNYDDNNNLVEYLNQEWDSLNWVNYDRYLYKYDNKKNMIESTFQNWEDFSFKNIARYLYTFDQNDYKTSEVYQGWFLDSTWISTGRRIYKYDSRGNNIKLIDQGKRYLNDSTWTDYFTWVTTYDVHNNKTSFVWQNWDGTNWVNYTKSNYINIPPNGIDGNLNNYWLANNYPNPFNSSTTIRYLIPTEEIVTLKVFNILGEESAILINELKPAGVYEISWNPITFSSGVYLYQLKAGDFIKTKKMILLK